jgi:hypothetical protein
MLIPHHHHHHNHYHFRIPQFWESEIWAKASQGWNWSVSYAGFLTGDCGEESMSKFIQVTGRIQFAVALWPKSIVLSGWLGSFFTNLQLPRLCIHASTPPSLNQHWNINSFTHFKSLWPLFVQLAGEYLLWRQRQEDCMFEIILA